MLASFLPQYKSWKNLTNTTRQILIKSGGFDDGSLSVYIEIVQQNKNISSFIKIMISVIKYNQVTTFLQNIFV